MQCFLLLPDTETGMCCPCCYMPQITAITGLNRNDHKVDIILWQYEPILNIKIL